MLVNFSYQNFLSFPNETTLSMAATPTVKELGEDNYNSNIINETQFEYKLLKVGAIYGANASGKSNLVKAMDFFKEMVVTSFNNERLIDNLEKLKFLFDDKTQKEPVSFEMTFIIKDSQYRYGFELLDNNIQSEWLFRKASGTSRESYCFVRENNNIKINPKTFRGASRLESKTRKNALFLSTTAQFNVGVSLEIKEWFENSLHILIAPNQSPQFTAKLFKEDPWLRQQVIDFIRLIDLGIDDVSITEIKELNKFDIFAHHKSSGQDTAIPFEMESLGTNKLFALLGRWFECLKMGGTLVVDEFGASIHTHLAIEMVRLFQSQLNINGAQLIIVTHDTNLLRRDLLRRDQIWFVEKNCTGASDLYSLVEYKVNQAQSVRNDASFQKDYLIGKYGAIPYFGNISQFITDYQK